MSQDSLSLHVLFEDETDAKRFASYWLPGKKDSSDLTEQGFPEKDEWSGATCSQKGRYVAVGGVIPTEEFRDEIFDLLGDLALEASLLSAEVIGDAKAARESCHFIDGEEKTEPELLQAALKAEPDMAAALQPVFERSGALSGTKKKVPKLKWHGEPKEIEAYLDAGGDPHVTIKRDEEAGLTLLIEYAWHLPLVERLLKAGLDPNAAMKEEWTNGHTPLLRAILAEEQYETWPCVKALLAAGADASGPGAPLAALAAKCALWLSPPTFPDDVFKISELLLEAGADATQTTSEGGNARWWFGGDRRLQALLDRFGVPQQKSMPDFIAEYEPVQRFAEALLADDANVAQQDLARILDGTDADVAMAARYCIQSLVQTEEYGERGARTGALERLRAGLHTLAERRPAAKQLIPAQAQAYFR